jgi:hypothetical protein
VPANSKTSEFVERAKTGGASDQTIVGILTAHGWSEREAYRALAAHYETTIGIEIPQHGSTGTAAKDAFFYLLVFSTLATWTIGLGSLAFTLIDQSLVDTLSSVNFQYESYSTAWDLASILVAFPIYLLVSRTIVREGTIHPEKLNSSVRKWLTYMALVIAAGFFVGDLITVLTYFLRGEITSRFLAKAFVVLVISGGVFFYYFGGLRRSEEPEVRAGSNRDRWMAALSAVAIVGMVVWGFTYLGAPKTQRMLRADQSRVRDLYQLSAEINRRWTLGRDSNRKLPGQLDELPNGRTTDPVTHTAYEYRVRDENQYELCATFSLPSQRNKAGSRQDSWSHPAGHYCFSLDAAKEPENLNIYPFGSD